VAAFFAAPLKWLFNNPAMKGWNEATDGMLGNGFAWGKLSPLFAFLYHVCPDLQPVDVFCTMMHLETTGADVSHLATIHSSDDGSTGDNGNYVVQRSS
jgi:hypothetical protein